MYESLYLTPAGRRVAALLARPGISKAAGRLMDSRVSALFIRSFIKKNHIDMSQAARTRFRSFNDFFTRTLIDGARPVAQEEALLTSPCDGLLTVYPITAEGVVTVKGTPYTASTLLENESLAESFLGGYLLVFRLTPAHYHRYAFPCDGEISESKRIQGVFHTVRPEALANLPVFKTNTREYAVLNTPVFGRVLQMEVGATMVGRICNTRVSGVFKKGEEKGRFEFGGSTVILFTEKNRFFPKKAYLDNTEKNLETPVCLGEAIGASDKNT